jgi:WD40 repeat protein
VCAREIEHALAHNKRMIPIVCRVVDTRVIQVPEPVGKLNWIRCVDANEFEPAIDKLTAAIQTDLDWTKQHTRILERAVEWNAAQRDDSFLLQKNDLAAAERWLAIGPNKEPKPTELQTRYVFDSRASATKRQRFMLTAVSAGLVITVVLAVLAWFQRGQAISQANIALARQLAAQAAVATSERPALLQSGVLLALESLERYPTLEADQFLRSAVPLLPRAVSGPMEHQGAVQVVTFAPDSKRLATASWDGTAGVWDTATGRRLLSLQPGQKNQRITAVTFSPNGALLATAGTDGIAQVWDAANGQRLGSPMTFRPSPMNGVVFSADGNYVATVSEHGADIWVLDAQSGPSRKVFSTSVIQTEFPCEPLSSFVFSPDGKHAAVSCRGQLRILETGSWRAIMTTPRKIRPGLTPPLHPIVFSDDGRYLASADEVYEVATGNLTLEMHSPAPVSAVAFSHDGDSIALASGDSVRLVKSSDGVQFAQLTHARTVRALDFSPDGKELATASEDNTARIWQLDPAREGTRISYGAPVWSVDFSPDGKYLATGSEDGSAGIWQAATAPFAADEVYGETEDRVVAVSANGRFAAVERGDLVEVREVPGGREIGRAPFHDDAAPNLEVAQASLSPDGRYLWMAVRERSRMVGHGRRPGEVQKKVRVWDASRGAAIASIEYDEVPGNVVFSGDARLLVTDDQTTLALWDVTNKREVTRVKHEQAPAAPVFSADGAHLAIVETGAVRIFETTRLQEIRRLPIGETTFRVVAFSPDGKHVAAGSNETVHLWELAGDRTSKLLPAKYASALLFSPDGRQLVIANWNYYDPLDRSVRIWDVAQLREVDRLPLLDIERAHYVDNAETQLAFSEDGRYLASENQGALRIWDTRTRRETERWESGYTTQLRFSPDGNYMISSADTTAAAWRWGAQAEIAKACKRPARNLNREEWRLFLGDAVYRKTCPELP